MSFVVDTDICSHFLKGHGRITAKFAQYNGRVYLSAVTVGELWAWALRKKAPANRQQDLANLLVIAPLLPMDEVVAERFGSLRAEQLDAGKPSPDLDLIIAATAIVNGFSLVTHNTKDFPGIPGLTILDWLIP